MNRTRCRIAVCCLGLIYAAGLYAKPASIMWYRQPAEHFTQSLPLGNGRLGMMVFGGVEQDRIVLNEESVWSGSPARDNRPDAYKRLPEIRRLLQQGRNVEAEQLVNETFTCQGKGSGHGTGANDPFGCYQVLGNLRLTFDADPNTVTEYRRELDLRSAVAQVSYKAGDVAFGVSIDTTFSKHAWAKSLEIEKTRLLSDFWPHGEVADAYGLFDDHAGRSERSAVILDEKGVVRWKKVYPVSERPDIEEILIEVEKI